MRIVSVRQQPEFKEKAIAYFQQSWPSVQPEIYEDCITHCIGARNSLPQWYLLLDGDTIIGCAGLITNDFISRADLYPWICAVYIDEKYRGQRYSALLIERAKEDTLKAGFDYLYLSTSHVGFYEKYGFTYIGDGYHPWGETSRIYEFGLRLRSARF